MSWGYIYKGSAADGVLRVLTIRRMIAEHIEPYSRVNVIRVIVHEMWL
jgi:hypothetical protein